MIDPDLERYLGTVFGNLDTRLSAVERESNHVHKNMLTAERAEKIFQTNTLRINSMTRIAVAVIAGIAVAANGTVNVITNHNREVLAHECAEVTQKEIDKAELRNETRDRNLAIEAAREEHKLDVLQFEAMTVTGSKRNGSNGSEAQQGD